MAKGKLSTPAIPMDGNVSVRKISNGFIVRSSGYTGKGKNQKYFEKEVFSESNPIKVSGNVKFGGK